jgi:hypothetical protein
MLDTDGNPILEEMGFASAGKNTAIHLLEFDAYYIRGDWSMYGQISYGQQKRSAIFNSDGQLRDARWWGASATVAYAITPRLEGIARLDYVGNTKNGGGLLGYSFDDASTASAAAGWPTAALPRAKTRAATAMR